MTVMPFICLGAGFLISFGRLSRNVLKLIDAGVDIALIALMFTIGMNIGVNESVMKNLPVIGLRCAVICLSAIGFSVLFTVLLEKTVLPLEALREKLYQEKLDAGSESDIGQPEIEDKKGSSSLVWIMPVSVMVGVAMGFFFLTQRAQSVLDLMLYGSLIFLYTGVGVSLGNNRKVFGYLKSIGLRVMWLPFAVFIGSLTGGFTAGVLLGLPLHIPLLSATGMGYYSITGAYMTQSYGIEVGTYGFMVNVMRDFFTVLLIPVLVRISKGSPIASGAAGNMDTMLVPVTKFVGVELGLIALITGVVVTFAVPFVLPVLSAILSGAF